MRKQYDKQKIGLELALRGQGQAHPLQNTFSEIVSIA
jgi:hypothetical protein